MKGGGKKGSIIFLFTRERSLIFVIYLFGMKIRIGRYNVLAWNARRKEMMLSNKYAV